MGSQQAMKHAVSVYLESSDRPRRVVAKRSRALTGTCACVWSVERGEGAARPAQETMIHSTGIQVVSNDRAHGIDVLGLSALSSACPRSRSIDRGDCAFTSAQEAVINIVSIYEEGRDFPLWVDASNMWLSIDEEAETQIADLTFWPGAAVAHVAVAEVAETRHGLRRFNEGLIGADLRFGLQWRALCAVTLSRGFDGGDGMHRR